jgi:hypothetical protein
MDEETREKLVHSLKAGMEIAKLAVFKDKSKQREDAYLLYQKSLRSFLTAIRVLQGKNNIDTFDSECDDGMMSSMRNRNDVQFQTERRMCQNRFSGCVFFFFPLSLSTTFIPHQRTIPHNLYSLDVS